MAFINSKARLLLITLLMGKLMACEDQISTQDLENAKEDATFLAEVSTSRDGGVSTGAPITEAENRFGDVTDTIQGRLNKLGVLYSDPITNWMPTTEITQLEAHRYPADTGEVYIPIAPLPFTTGATFNTANWSLVLTTVSDQQIVEALNNSNEYIRLFDTRADMVAEDILPGFTVQTSGKIAQGDGLGRQYLIKTEAEK